MIEKKLHERLKELFPKMVSLRRHLHQHPELSNEEFETAAFIYEFYKMRHIPVRKNVGGNGVVATIKGKYDGKTIALRADFDALPIQDKKDVSYASKQAGVMHACGHDGHTAQLLYLAQALFELREELHGTIVLIHQHAEELAPGGAQFMIEDGCLDGVDYVYGTHLWATDPLGQISTRPGPIMAAADRFKITIHGRGGHGAEPHKTKDAIVIGSQLVLNMQQIISRMTNPLQPAVISIGSFEAKNAFNVIADEAVLTGTVRTFNENVQHDIIKQIEKVAQVTSSLYDASCTVTYSKGYPAVINNEHESDFILGIAESIPSITSVVTCEPHMGGEDFAYYLQNRPGCFFFTGAAKQNETLYPHHHPLFDFDERAMLVAAQLLGSIAIQKGLEH